MGISEFTGKLVIVTGGAAGIGRETALAFARAGARLALADLNKAALESTREEIEACGTSCHTACLDVSDKAGWEAYASELMTSVGVPHVLVNNAGFYCYGNLAESTPDLWEKMWQINVMGVAYGCQAFMEAMHDAGDNRCIVNISSIAGVAANPNMGVYAASKAAVLSISDTLAIELAVKGSKLGVTVVLPSVIKTGIADNAPMGASITPEKQKQMLEFKDTSGTGPDVVARDLVDGVRKGKAVVCTGPSARSLYMLWRVLSRSLARRMTVSMVKRLGM